MSLCLFGLIRTLERGEMEWPTPGRSWKSSSAAKEGSGHGTKPARVQEAFGQWRQAHDVILGVVLFRGRSRTSMTFVGPFQYSVFMIL